MTMMETRPEVRDSGEESLRPSLLSEFEGQPDIRESLTILLQAAKGRGEAVDHCLFYGPPGLGKTTLARIVAEEMGSKMHAVTGPALEKPADLVTILAGCHAGDVLFIDEIHRMPMVVEEVLYPAMEDFHLDVVLGQGPEARTVTLPLEPFTLTGATTRLGDLSNPLRDRFGATFRLDYYGVETLASIAHRTARLLGTPIHADAAELLAVRGRGTPRIVNRLVRRARDYAQVKVGREDITIEAVEGALSLLKIDRLGLDMMDRRLLRSIADLYNGGPVGLKTMSALISEPVNTVSDAIEPFLMRQGLIKRTQRGRELTEHGWAHVRATRGDR